MPTVFAVLRGHATSGITAARMAARQVPTTTAASPSSPQSLDVTFKELHERATRVARQLVENGIHTGDRVAIILPNGLDFVVAFLGSLYARAVAAPLNPELSQNEFEFFLEDAGSKVAIVPAKPIAHAMEAAKKLRVPVWQINVAVANANSMLRPVSAAPIPPRAGSNGEPQPDDIALFLHTSGTTGRPKGVPLSNANLVASMNNIRNSYQITQEDRSLIVMPLFHVHGLVGVLLTSLLAGASVVIQDPKFSARAFWPHFVNNDCTWFSAVPTIHQILLKHAKDDFKHKGKLRFVRSGSSALPGPVLHQLEATFGAPVLEAYAMSEAAHQMTTNPLPPQEHKPNSVGKPVGLEVAILRHGDLGKDTVGDRAQQGERGEVVIHGANVTKGYWKNPEANATSFVALRPDLNKRWFRTGDEGCLDNDGYLFLTGRIKELINRGGEKIAPPEVDAVILSHPAIVEAVCFGVPDELYGQAVHAAVVLSDGHQVTEDELRAFMRTKVAAFKVPSKFYFVKEMPRTATGKIQRKAISELLFKPASKL